MPAAQDNTRAVAIMLLATAVIAVSDTLVRLTTEMMPISQFLVMRGCISIAIFTFVVATAHGRTGLAMTLRPLVLLRAVLEASSVVLYIVALQVLMIAEVTAIYLASPIITSAVVAMFGMEHVSASRWIALSMGFFGVVLVMTPDVGQLNLAALLALGSAALVGLRDIVTRRMPTGVASSVVTLTTTTIVSLSGVCLIPFEPDWSVPDIHQLTLLVGASVVVCLGNLLAVAAFRSGEIALVSLFRYASLPFALVVGGIVWGELPSTSQLIGSAIVVCSGVIMLSGRRYRRRA